MRAQSVSRDIVYTTDSTGTYHADLYRPSHEGTAPAVVLIHGGSWRSGSKREMRKLATDLAAHGYVCFSIDYDLHAKSFPISWQETREAVRFLGAHAAEYGIDPQRIAVLGTSAGGQMAALAGLAPQGPAAPTPDGHAGMVPVAAVVALNGLYDASVKSLIVRRYLGGRCSEIAAVCNDASPQMQVHPGAVPFFVGHGDHDHLIPYVLATRFIAALQAAGDPVTPFVASHGGHSYWKKKRFYTPNLLAVEGFLDKALNKS